MPKTLVVGSEEFEFPVEGDNGADSGGYGESVTAWAEAVSTALGTVQQPNDIPVTSASILNSQTSAVPILGFSFNTSEVIAIQGDYIVRRSTTSPATNVVQSGKIEGNFDGTSWTITHERIGNSGVNFDITGSGQITYTSTNITGSGYEGEIIFKARVFNQPE